MFNPFGSTNKYDTAQIAAEYSKRIASIIEVAELAKAAGHLLADALNTTRVALLVFNEGKEQISLDVLSGYGRTPPFPLKLPPNHNFFTTLNQLPSPFVASKFAAALPAEERKAFAKLELLVFMPIREDKNIVALLAVGARKNKEKYGSREIELLSLIADQTTLALKNARLVSNLRTLNTEMQTLNETLATANLRLRDMDKVKMDFITITSHELRTPLTQILGYSDLLGMMGDSPTVNGKELKDLTASIIKACNRLNEVITQMLDVSQIDVEALQLKMSETNFETILRSAVEKYALAIRERKLNFTVQNVRGLPNLTADPQRLAQALGQIIGNAIKYTPDGGHIDVAFKLLPRDNQRPESIQVTVADSGVGINPKYLESIFEKFFRVGKAEFHSTGTTKFMGAGPGLGLAIAKGIVEGHAGKIWAESSGFDTEKLPGAQIHFTIPLKPPAFATKNSPAVLGVDLGGDDFPEIKV